MVDVYKDPTKTPTERAEDLIKRMTLEEKIGQSCQLDLSHKPEKWIKERNIGSYLNIKWKDCQKLQKMAMEETRLGIPLIFGIDAVHGHAFHDGATVFPSPLAMSCSWNPELLEEIAHITAIEMRATGFHWTFAPVLCMGRDPRWGRINETFGEDPYLITKLGVAMVQGFQGNDLSNPDSVLACPKHFVAYGESIGGRDSVEAEVSRRKLRSLFFPPFEAAVKAGCGSIMAGYHSINGTPCSANSWLMKQVLRNEWGFEGFVVTDWDNITWLHELQKVVPTLEEAVALGIRSGNDMIMSTPKFYEIAIKLVKEKVIREELIDEMCLRILTIKFRLGLYESERGNKRFPIKEVVNTSEHKKKALEAALQSIVLLKNDKNILPLKVDCGNIAVIGPNADNPIAQLGDWSFGTVLHWPPQDKDVVNGHKDNVVTVRKGIEMRVDGKSKISFKAGCDIIDASIENITEAVQVAQHSDVIIAVVGDSLTLTGERKDRASLDLSGAQLALLKALREVGKPLVVVLINGKPLTIPWVAENADAIIEAWNPGNEGGNAIASVLFGDYNPSGKLTISFPRHVGQIPVYYNHYDYMWHGGKYIDIPSNPLYPFGFGLSYTRFEYSNLYLPKKTFKKSEILSIAIDIKNLGQRIGLEIIQVYVADLFSSVVTPIRELKQFQRIVLNPLEKKTIKFKLPISSLFLVNDEEQFIVESGTFEIAVGSSSMDHDLLKERIQVN